MSEYLWDAQSALHEVVWTILMSAPSKSFTTCCNLKSKEFDFCNKEERDSTTSNISERNIFLGKCGDLVTLQYVLRVMERIGAKCPDPGFQDSTCWSVFFVMNFSMSSLSNSYSFFIGPRSDHSLPMSVTDSLTDWLTDELVEDLMNWPLTMQTC